MYNDRADYIDPRLLLPLSVAIEGFLMVQFWDGEQGVFENLHRLRILIVLFAVSLLFLGYLINRYLLTGKTEEAPSSLQTFEASEPKFDVMTVHLRIDPSSMQNLPTHWTGPQMDRFLERLGQARLSWSAIESTMVRALPYDEADQKVEQFQPPAGAAGYATISMIFVSLQALPVVDFGDGDALHHALSTLRGRTLRSFAAFVVR